MHEQADTVILDVTGPVPYELTGSALYALAEGRTPARPAEDPAVAEALRAVLAAEPGVTGAHLTPGGDSSDGTLALALAPGADVSAVARRLAGALAADEALRARLVRGLDLALLPPGSVLPEGSLYRR